MFERIKAGESVKVVASTPPRHGKTELELHGIGYLLADDPSRQFAFVGYSSTFAEDKSRKAREIARAVGVPISQDAWARKNWRTGVGEGGVWATSIDGPVTGVGFSCILIDDPVKDRATAESAIRRQHTYDWFTDTLFTRLEPGGSIVVVQTRWHPDDLAGRLIADGWEFINLPAINDGTDPEREVGEALWPERWPVTELEKIQAQLGEYGWTSLYQGQPRSRGGAVFRDAYYFDDLPGERRYAIGFDLAYSAKTYSDYSVAVVMAVSGDKHYVLNVVRLQVDAPTFAERLKILQASAQSSCAYGYIGGTEQGNVSFMQGLGVLLEAFPAKTDKFVRAQPVAAAWNGGRVLLPSQSLLDDLETRARMGDEIARRMFELMGRGEWIEDFLTEVCGFTGVKDAHDDQVDALAGAFDGAQAGCPTDWEYVEACNHAAPKPITW